MWQSFALLDQRGTVWGIYDDLEKEVEGCVDHNEAEEDKHEDQRTYYTLIAWKWAVPLNPDKERSIYVHPDIWVKCPKDWRVPTITANEDNLMLANNVDPCDERFHVYYPLPSEQL